MNGGNYGKEGRQKEICQIQGRCRDVQHGFDKISGACKAGKRYL